MPCQHACQRVRVVKHLTTTHLFAHFIIVDRVCSCTSAHPEHLLVATSGCAPAAISLVYMGSTAVDHNCNLDASRLVIVQTVGHTRAQPNTVIRCASWQSAPGTSSSVHVSAAVRIFWLAPELQLPACFLHALFELVHVIAFEFVSSSTVWFIPFPPL